MTTGPLLLLQIILHMTAAAVYNYNETSEEIPDRYNPEYLSGFRNIVDKDFIIGGLFTVLDCRGRGLDDLEMLEAMLFAIDRINNDMSLLPNLTIGYDVRDSCNSEIIGLNEALGFYIHYNRNRNITTPTFLGIVGPAYTTVTSSVATVMSVEGIQIPLISYASSDAALSNRDIYKYLLRTIPSDNLQTDAMVDLVSHFGWDYVSVIFSDNDYGISASDAFANSATKHGICIDKKIGILSSKMNETVVEAVQTLLKSTATVVVLLLDSQYTVSALFKELGKNNTQKFGWIFNDKWNGSQIQKIHDEFPEITKVLYSFQLHTDHIKEFDDYFSQLTPSINIRNPFYHNPKYNIIYNHLYCEVSGSGNKGSSSGYKEPAISYDCPDNVTAEIKYTQGRMVPFVIDAVYAYAYTLQNFLDDNCDSPLKWNRVTQRCDGMKDNLTSETFLEYLYDVTFNGIRNHNVSFDKNGDPTGAYGINYLQKDDNGQYKVASLGFWNSAYKENTLTLNNAYGIEEIISTCSDPCNEGMVHSIINQNCQTCFKCIPCVGSTYSNNSNTTNCTLCDDNHWGNNPLSGSTHCVPVKVQHLDYSNGWSIVSMCFASILLIILTVIIVIFAFNWKTPVVKSSDREQMVMLLVGIGICCILTFVIVAPPSTAVCVFQRVYVWFWFSLAFGALLVKIIRVARIFYSIKSSAERPSFTQPIYQAIFTIAIVSFQLLLVLIGLIIDHPVVKRDPEVVTTSFGQTGNAPEIIETCEPSHTAIMVLSLIYNSALIIGCTILGLRTNGFPENFNEAKHVMFASFTLMVVWVLFIPVYLYTEDEFRPGVLALSIILSALALIASIFFPRIYIIVFQKHKNTIEYLKHQNHLYIIRSTDSSKTFRKSKTLAMHIQ